MLPKVFKPSGQYDLVRLGKNNDGGYLICVNSYKQSDCLVSFGINNDFSFEKDFKGKTKIKILAFDPTVTNNFFFKEILLNLLSLKINKFFFSIINFIKFKSFFNSNDNQFFLKKIGKGGNVNLSYISIDEIIKLTDNSSNIFFKIDIEGSEYRILDEILQFEDMISGLTIEFHDVDLNQNRIENFINKTKLKLIHIHANNWMDYGLDAIPTCIEMSFSKNPNLINDKVELPHKLDQKNNPDSSDIILKFNK